MPALTITAVDHTTDTLTIVGHGLLTGAGPGAVRNIGGALPGNVAPVTDYWIIAVDADTIKLADSSADAMANTPRALSGNGSGINVLEIGIPYRRARTYVPKSVSVAGAQVKSDDLNAAMDSLKALHALLTGQAQSVWTHCAPHAIASSAFSSGDGSVANTARHHGAYVDQASNPGSFLAPIVLPVGTQLKSWLVAYDRNGSGTVTPAIVRVELATGTVGVSVGVDYFPGSADSSGSGIETQTLDLGGHVMAAGYAYYVQVLATATANRLYGAIINP